MTGLNFGLKQKQPLTEGPPYKYLSDLRIYNFGGNARENIPKSLTNKGRWKKKHRTRRHFLSDTIL